MLKTFVLYTVINWANTGKFAFHEAERFFVVYSHLSHRCKNSFTSKVNLQPFSQIIDVSFSCLDNLGRPSVEASDHFEPTQPLCVTSNVRSGPSSKITKGSGLPNLFFVLKKCCFNKVNRPPPKKKKKRIGLTSTAS